MDNESAEMLGNLEAMKSKLHAFTLLPGPHQENAKKVEKSLEALIADLTEGLA